MADDFQDKTEEPTAKKLADARKKGQVAKSQDLTAAVILLSGMLILLGSGGFILQRIEMFTAAVLNNLTEPFDSAMMVNHGFGQGVIFTAITVLPLFLGLMVAAFLVNVYQVQFMFSTDPLKPKWKNINIFDPSLYKRFANLQAIMRLVFGLGKLTVIGVVCYVLIKGSMIELSRLMHGDAADIFNFVAYYAFLIGFVTALILIFLGLCEYAYQKWKFRQDMKMSKQEVKDERRQMEGDAHVRGKMRSMMQSIVQSRMKENVPHADVIIANPVHFAVAIKYDSEKLPAPVCVAKGARKMALAIREIAEEHGIPVVENPPLAQGLYRSVEVGELVPPDFYHSVAEVLAYVYRLNATMEANATR